MDDDELAQYTMAAITAALDGDDEGIGEALDAIADTEDPYTMYAACCGFAEIARQSMVKLYGAAPDTDAGDMWQVIPREDRTLEPPELFAMRFITTYANNDPDLPPVLYRAALESSPEEFTDSVLCLLLDTARLLHAMREATA